MQNAKFKMQNSKTQKAGPHKAKAGFSKFCICILNSRIPIDPITRSHQPPRLARQGFVVELESRGPTGIPTTRLRAVASDGAQPGAYAAGAVSRHAGARRRRSGMARPLRSRDRAARRGPRRAEHLVREPLP